MAISLTSFSSVQYVSKWTGAFKLTLPKVLYLYCTVILNSTDVQLGRGSLTKVLPYSKGEPPYVVR